MDDPLLVYKTPRHEPVRVSNPSLIKRFFKPRTTLSPKLLASRGAMAKTILAEGEVLVKKGLLAKAGIFCVMLTIFKKSFFLRQLSSAERISSLKT